jgi:hypothetical protein
MPKWLERTDLNLLLDLDGLTETRFLNALDHLDDVDAEASASSLLALCRQKK